MGNFILVLAIATMVTTTQPDGVVDFQANPFNTQFELGPFQDKKACEDYAHDFLSKITSPDANNPDMVVAWHCKQ